MSASEGNPPVLCTVCNDHTPQEALEAQGLVLTALVAYYQRDFQTIKDTYGTFTPFDAHVAVTMLANLIEDMCEMQGVPLALYMAMFRRAVSDKQAQA